MNDYWLDDALDWLRAHVTDAPEDAIARALIEALDDDEWQVHLEVMLDRLMTAKETEAKAALLDEIEMDLRLAWHLLEQDS